jgi:hypothetical protein
MKKCIACQTEIDDKATFCKHCSQYQNKYKNYFSYIATIMGVLIAIVAVIGFLFDIPGYLSNRKEVEVVSVRTMGNQNITIDVINHNKNTAQLTAMRLMAKFDNEEFDSSIPINLIIPGNDIKHFNTGIYDEHDPINKKYGYALLNGDNRKDDEYVYKFPEIYENLKKRTDKECLYLSIISSNHDLMSIGNHTIPNDIKIKSEITYRYIVAGTSTSKEKTIPALTQIGLKFTDECFSKYAEKK